MKAFILIPLFVIYSMQVFTQELYFPPSFDFEWESIEDEELEWCEDNVEAMQTFLGEKNTKAFIVLKNGKIAMESYFDGHEISTPWYWASAGKSLTAVLVGLAQEEGIVDINEPTSTYLGDGWTSCPEDEESQITVEQQMKMTTGLNYLVSINCTDPECLSCLNPPGEEWFYHNAPYTLLSSVIENASGQTYTSYTNERLASKLGFVGLWSLTGDNQLFFSTARGMARFGLFMLAEGAWDGDQLMMDKDYFQKMISSSQSINEAYGYLWWLNGKDTYKLPGSNIVFDGKLIENAPDDLYAGIGKNGQVCIVVPSKKLVLIRMGDNPDESLVPLDFVRDLWDEYEKLSCATSTNEITQLDVDVWPRLTSGPLYLSSNQPIDEVRIYNKTGRLVLNVEAVDMLDVSLLKSGFYLIQIIKGNQSVTKRFMKIR